MQAGRASYSHAIAALLVLIFCSAPAVLAQQSVSASTLAGRVEDTTGAAIGGARIAVTSIDKNQTSSSTSDEHGRYSFLYLPVGGYQLKVEHEGFATVTLNLTLSVGQALDLPVRLGVAGLTESASVSAAPPVVETVRTQVSETVLSREVDSLPLNGRNYLDLAALTPAVSRANPVANQRFAETSAVPGTQISVTGQRNINNGFILDGLSSNDDAADLPSTFFSQEVIREFQVITSGGIAEFGRASAGFINVVTQSGSNAWRGPAYGFLRNQRLDARNPLAPTKDPLTQAQYGASLGGPIIHDRTFLFGNFEQTRRNYSAVLTIAPAAVNSINNRLRAVNYPGSLIETGVVPASFDTTNFFARIDHRINERNQLNARYSLYHIEAVNSRNVGGLNAVSRGTGIKDTDQTLQVSNVTTLSNRTVNELRFQYTNSRLDAPVNDEIGPAVNIGGIANFGTATVSPLARDINLFE